MGAGGASMLLPLSYKSAQWNREGLWNKPLCAADFKHAHTVDRSAGIDACMYTCTCFD